VGTVNIVIATIVLGVWLAAASVVLAMLYAHGEGAAKPDTVGE
jgi:hypothetical protein